MQVLSGKGPKLVLDLPTACFRAELEPAISALMRHILEDPATLQAAMEAEIRATLGKQKSPPGRAGAALSTMLPCACHSNPVSDRDSRHQTEMDDSRAATGDAQREAAYCALLPLHLRGTAPALSCSLCQCVPSQVCMSGCRAARWREQPAGEAVPAELLRGDQPRAQGVLGGCAGDLLHQGEWRAACGGPQKAQGRHPGVDDAA